MSRSTHIFTETTENLKPIVKHFGWISNGRVFYHNKDLYFQQLTQLEGKQIEVVFKERIKKPSVDQYGYYRGAILGACFESEEFSHFDKPDDIHKEYFAPKFLSYTKMVTVGDKKHEVVLTRSMADLNRKETSEFIERALADCGLHGIIVLSPDEYLLKNYSK